MGYCICTKILDYKNSDAYKTAIIIIIGNSDACDVKLCAIGIKTTVVATL